jgi:hypothetical protein
MRKLEEERERESRGRREVGIIVLRLGMRWRYLTYTGGRKEGYDRGCSRGVTVGVILL